MNQESKVYVAGHRGMVGAAIIRELQAQGIKQIITRTHKELDLTRQEDVVNFLDCEKPDTVILAAAKVGGIFANNQYPAEFIYQNLMIECNIIHQSWQAGVKQLLFLGSSCIYPKFAPQPMKEEHLLTGLLEPTNEPYAVAKIAGIKMCEAYNRQYGMSYRSVMPTNLYGTGDNYHLENSHVIPAMIRKYHLAKLAQAEDEAAVTEDEKRYGKIPADIAAAIGYIDGRLKADITPKVILWGTGQAMREFLYVDDMAAACLHVMRLPREKFLSPEPSFVNIGTGTDCTIAEIAEIIAEEVGFSGETVFDSTKPDGTPRKLLDISRIERLGWRPRYSFREGVKKAYKDYLDK